MVGLEVVRQNFLGELVRVLDNEAIVSTVPENVLVGRGIHQLVDFGEESGDSRRNTFASFAFRFICLLTAWNSDARRCIDCKLLPESFSAALGAECVLWTHVFLVLKFKFVHSCRFFVNNLITRFIQAFKSV